MINLEIRNDYIEMSIKVNVSKSKEVCKMIDEFIYKDLWGMNIKDGICYIRVKLDRKMISFNDIGKLIEDIEKVLDK